MISHSNVEYLLNPMWYSLLDFLASTPICTATIFLHVLTWLELVAAASYMISANFPKSGETSVVVTVWMWPYAHPQLFKMFKHLIYVWHRCGMQFERFYSLSDSVVGSFCWGMDRGQTASWSIFLLKIQGVDISPPIEFPRSFHPIVLWLTNT